MLTIFSVPKAFRNEFAIIQYNAIKSWTLFKPKPEIILFGDENGISEICKNFNLIHFPKIKTNQYKTPLLNDAFEKAQKIAKNKILMYANSDIIFPKSFTEIIYKISRKFKSFLATGQRYELRINRKIDLSDPNWRKKIIDLALFKNQLKEPGWIDYFIFTKGLFKNLPPFAIGRTFWDKWLVWKAVSKNAPVIDLTTAVIAIHQTHTYSYGNKTKDSVWEGKETLENIKLAGGWSHGYSLKMADYILENNKFIKQKNIKIKRLLTSLFRKGLDVFSFQSLLLKIRRWKNKI